MLHLNSLIPAVAQLQAEGLPIDANHTAGSKEVALLNIMPEKCVTELDLCRMLAASGIDINLTLIKIPGQTYKTTPQEYMDTHYVDADAQWRSRDIDGLIITGAPLENMPFEQVRYWPELCQLMAWSTMHVRSTLNICWAAQAAIYFHHGVEKHPLSAKMFGIFAQDECALHPLLNDIDRPFSMPHSRHTEVRREEIPERVQLVSYSHEAGVGIVVDEALRQVFVFGHLEYEPTTLDREYRRDLAKGLSIAPPLHYYHNEQPSEGIRFSWREAALRFYRNWTLSL